jgi:uncharacterized protein (DUF433 family)
VNTPLSPKELEAVRLCIARNRPFGNDAWQARSVTPLELPHTLRAEGRPRKKSVAGAASLGGNKLRARLATPASTRQDNESVRQDRRIEVQLPPGRPIPLRQLDCNSFLWVSLALRRRCMDYRKILTMEPGKRSGQPCIRGLRITVYDVLGYLASGMSPAEILHDFPDLTAEDIAACLSYAADREKQLLAVAV